MAENLSKNFIDYEVRDDHFLFFFFSFRYPVKRASLKLRNLVFQGISHDR